MLHRALFWLLPAVLVLTFALPAPSAFSVYGTAIECGAEGGPRSIARLGFLPDDGVAAFSAWSEPDDEDRVVLADMAIPVWPPVAIGLRSARTSDVLRCTYSTSAAFARGPPSV